CLIEVSDAACSPLDISAWLEGCLALFSLSSCCLSGSWQLVISSTGRVNLQGAKDHGRQGKATKPVKYCVTSPRKRLRPVGAGEGLCGEGTLASPSSWSHKSSPPVRATQASPPTPSTTPAPTG